MIHLNQVGYYPDATKVAIVVPGTSPRYVTKTNDGSCWFTNENLCIEKIDSSFDIYDAKSHEVVFSGSLIEGVKDPVSGDKVYYADFSQFNKKGSYYICVPGSGKSYSFQIEDNVYGNTQKALLKALYFQRCGCSLDKKHAGLYSHDICHTKISKLLENPSVEIDATGGWHDAGDYGKYITPAATTIGHLLYAYKLFASSFEELTLIPESGNGVPDILNECRYELEWMLKMQDKDSGGVYHKVTTLRHADFIMPEKDTEQMYVFPVSSLATADFAASMALAYDVFKTVDLSFANSMKEAALLAGTWLEKNPQFVPAPDNPPNGNTGLYDNNSDLDERLWAASELYGITEDKKYQQLFLSLLESVKSIDYGWENVSGLGILAYVFNNNDGVDIKIQKKLKEMLIADAEYTLNIHKKDAYGTALLPEHYVWGSNMVVANRAMSLILGEILTKNKEYGKAALEQIHYLLGKNPMGVSYITGCGENAYKNPHLRTTAADGIDEPMPGWVSGGPNKNPCDGMAPWFQENPQPVAKRYLDLLDCYSLNEMTIYWNSPVIFALAYFQR
jgi:endoglucanase